MGGCVGKKEEKGERHRAWVSALLRDVSVRCFVLRRERKSSVYYVSKRKRIGDIHISKHQQNGSGVSYHRDCFFGSIYRTTDSCTCNRDPF